MTQQQYNEAINLIGHLILTASDTLTELLAHHGVGFETAPTKRQLIDATIEKLKSDTDGFTKGLAKLVDRHIDIEVDSMVWLRKVGFDLPDAEDAFFGGLIKGAIGAIGGLLKKKKSNNNNSSNNVFSSQAMQAKRDLELQIQRMQEQQRRRDEERRREEAERARLEREAQAKKRTQTMLIIGGVVLLVSLVGVALFMSRSKAPMYNPSRP
ncbi:hypothetical protein [uncultured Dokdonia sp.]|uniref:hypothetical protein n=1 Tax=uncultured Dokdonia sp. TaxID=575653 RepID=UPI0026342719|nr:hypothetical protein [uncultured Dokdonia sp.]